MDLAADWATRIRSVPSVYPDRIDPAANPGGIVVHIYDADNATLLLVAHGSDDVDHYLLGYMADGRSAAVIVTYDGDSGERCPYYSTLDAS